MRVDLDIEHNDSLRYHRFYHLYLHQPIHYEIEGKQTKKIHHTRFVP